jgi:glutamyl-tRNA synthetase/glutamyl-Q tRNA(Asp) synthetase
VLLRIEDHDLGRRRPAFEPAVIESMQWLGFAPDRGLGPGERGTSVYRQSDGAAYYETMLRRLAQEGLVYGCSCSRKTISAVQPTGAEELHYPGTCAEKGLPLEGHTVRFRISNRDVEFRDRRLGLCRQTPQRQCGDVALRDRAGQWSYQFCCVCDDIRHGVDLVIRGEDILSSTGRQILLLDAFGAVPPVYLHHRLLYGTDGRKLSKRQRSQSVGQMRKNGASPETVLGSALHAAGLLPEPQELPLSKALALAAADRD